MYRDKLPGLEDAENEMATQATVQLIVHHYYRLITND